MPKKEPQKGRKPTAKALEGYESSLRTILAMLNGDIDRLEEEALGSPSKVADGKEDGGTDNYFQEFSLQLLERDESTLREVLDALKRLENGTFGKCSGCDAWILRERLKAMPHARNCIACQRAEEEGVS